MTGEERGNELIFSRGWRQYVGILICYSLYLFVLCRHTYNSYKLTVPLNYIVLQSRSIRLCLYYGNYVGTLHKKLFGSQNNLKAKIKNKNRITHPQPWISVRKDPVILHQNNPQHWWWYDCYLRPVLTKTRRWRFPFPVVRVRALEVFVNFSTTHWEMHFVERPCPLLLFASATHPMYMQNNHIIITMYYYILRTILYTWHHIIIGFNIFSKISGLLWYTRISR